ncbi:RHS Repeat protein [Kordia sp. SMS9]|uniref:hypothetical protein n=1 Tax=Kordia sp. SMS9 TaxID=2282170 RepID=UPI000E0D1BCE|nr:hypothetical protein [Kordia sp. SMS9]AXG69741.1 RHS Repeat protein [Kordia sp. SMS9]
MKTYLLSIIAIFSIYNSNAQVENTKEAIVKNKVKSSEERHCFIGSSGSCTVIYEAYDNRGNIIEWNMGRLGTRYKYQYDQKNRKVATIWIDKSDTTKVDTILFKYDEFDKLVSENNNPYPHNSENLKNWYDHKNRLIKQISRSKNHEQDSIISTTILEWTDFDKMKSEYRFSHKLDAENDTLYTHKKIYEYDSYENLTREVHSKNNEVFNTICYEYDASLRLIKKSTDNSNRIKMLNEHKYGNRKDIDVLLTTFTYDSQGRIKEKYTYFSDPCMSLDNHFTYKHFYKKNGLLDYVNVFEEEMLRFTISYKYTFY